MNMPMDATAGKQSRVVDVKTVVVYRAQDGHILHLHEVVTLEGAKPPAPDDVEKTALAHAADRGQRTGVATLHVAPIAFKPETGYRVDPAARKLVEFAMPQRQP